MIPTLLKRLLLSAVFAAGSGAVALAHTPSDPAAVKDLGKLTSLANLVVQTKVVKVEYKVSAPGANGAKGLPTTFVTFSIASVISGSSPGSSLTLSFVGGPDGQGGFLAAEAVPTFQVGDQDILFVVNNGSAPGCALVMCEFGRFRISGGAVYGTHGEPVLSLTAGKLTLGSGYGPDQFHSVSYPAPSFDDLMKNPDFAAAVRSKTLVPAAARAEYDAHAPKTIVVDQRDSDGIDGAMNAMSTAASSVSVGQFLSGLGTAAAAAPAKATAAVQSAAIGAPLTVPDAVGVAPPAGSN